MQYTKNEFKRNIAEVRKWLVSGDDEALFNSGDGMGRHYAWLLSPYSGWSQWLYSEDAEAIENPAHLNNVLNRWPQLDAGHRPSGQVWFMLADVHY